MSEGTPEDGPPIPVRVECHAGHRGEETPRRLHFGRRAVEVEEVIDRWLAPDHRYFKLKGSDGATYILRHEEQGGTWEVVMYERPRGERGVSPRKQ